MLREYTRFALDWSDRNITVSYQRKWLKPGQWLIELRCDVPLPVTSTGYRSHFMSRDVLADEGALRTHVLNGLTAAADTPEWRRHVEDSRQLKLL